MPAYKTYEWPESRPYGNMVRADLIRQLRGVEAERQGRLGKAISCRAAIINFAAIPSPR